MEWKTDVPTYPNGGWWVTYGLPGDKLRGTSSSPSLSDAIEQAEARRTEFGFTGTVNP